MEIAQVCVLGGSGFGFGRARPGACPSKHDEAARLTCARRMLAFTETAFDLPSLLEVVIAWK
jgi:hypothetical protein